MLNAKDYFYNDLSNFMNTNEFAEMHRIANKTLNVIVDNDRLKERSKKEYDGIIVGDVLIFVKAKDYGQPPKPDSILYFDGKPYLVFDVRNDMGMYEIILKLNAS
ncbi:hypothetical protein [Clostridium sporogenes]|uniref:hypothetical protein n=1 Tax=Clostridium sporogenes TaxID=1509 RepID=UPI0006690668|nr:hypothetical protein [Clostridium sporogenes]